MSLARAHRPDKEALLVALVLAPATFSRNRFFHLYTDPEVRRVRHRASQIRSIVKHLTRERSDERACDVSLEQKGEGAALTYVVPSLGLRRTSYLDATELSLIRYAATRVLAEGSPLPVSAEDRARIDGALARNAPAIHGDTSRGSISPALADEGAPLSRAPESL